MKPLALALLGSLAAASVSPAAPVAPVPAGTLLIPVSYTHLDVYKRQAFNGDIPAGIVPTRNWAFIAASDVIIHF